MKKATYFLILVISLLALGSCARVQRVEVSQVESVQLLGMTDSTADIAVSLRIQNPNKMKIQVKSSDLVASINNHPVGNVNITEKIIIPKKSHDLYTVLLKADMREVKKLLPSLMFSSKALIGLNGVLQVKAKGINKKVNISVAEKVAKKDLKNIMG